MTLRRRGPFVMILEEPNIEGYTGDYRPPTAKEIRAARKRGS